jgi:hypothetical protein
MILTFGDREEAATLVIMAREEWFIKRTLNLIPEW